jgi:8-oxo-dGTP pyrophosphatase MutT (NUDIX family)
MARMMPTEISSGAVVFRETPQTEYLLLRYGAGHWGFVKGQIERGEKPEETARRELKEETGIREAEVINGFQEKVSYYYKRQGETVYKEVVYRLFHVKGSRVVLSDEHTDYAWLSCPLARGRLTHQNTKHVLWKAQQTLAKKRGGEPSATAS